MTAGESRSDAAIDDFGLSPIATLSRVADPTPCVEHAPLWNRWQRVIAGEPKPLLHRRERGASGIWQVDPSDDTATYALCSLFGVRIGARLLLPPRGTPARAGLVSSHGYAASKPLSERDGLFESCVARGVAVLNIRVRGFPGSRLDVGDLSSGGHGRLGWIAHGLDDEDSGPDGFLRWVYPQGVADVFNACRAMRRLLNEQAGASAPLFLHGESFGGGLAVAAAAKLVGRPEAITTLDRLVLGWPSMGDWPWRLEHASSGGMGGDVRAVLDRRRDLAEVIRSRLRAADSVVLAARVRTPTLCKLAERDQVVPARTAAAVFNALAADPGRKWRFVVPHGHAETGIANARRHAAFERLAQAFCDPDRRVEDVMAGSSDHLHVSKPPSDESAGPAATLFGPAESRDGAEAQLVAAYQAADRTLDDLPHTDEFEQLYTTVAKALNLDRRGVFHKLHNLRKAGRLPRVGRGPTKPTRLEPEENRLLTELVVGAVGSLGHRDRLPFTPEFDDIVQRFNARTGRALTSHDVWRVIAKLAK
mgnify:CR=1 FL=1